MRRSNCMDGDEEAFGEYEADIAVDTSCLHAMQGLARVRHDKVIGVPATSQRSLLTMFWRISVQRIRTLRVAL